ncbi:MAG: TldD/PmbA family protein [Acidobacteria bacterium]|nr:TldD/PmbA family protein [Acidobacteriota bacterium]
MKDAAFGIIERALRIAGVAESDAVFLHTDQNISRFANSNVHQNMADVSASLTLRVIVDSRMGVASTTAFDDGELARVAELAREAARHADKLPNFSGLYHDGEPVPLLRTFDDATAKLSPMDKARALRTMFDRGRTAGVLFAGSYTTGLSSVACGNTHGVRRFCEMTFADASVIALHANASGFATRCARGNDAVDILALGEEATFKATLLGDRLAELEHGAYDVILEPPAIAEVLDWMNMIAFTGQSFDDRSSFFADRIGEQVLGTNFTVADDAVDDDFLPFPFDMEGMPKRRVALIERGVIRTPVLDKAYADRLGLPPTANAWDLGSPDHGSAFHIAVEGGDATRDELIRSTKRGIWVTRFNYVNGLLEPTTALMTGTTRDGTFLIRDGEVVARLPNLRWTQSMLEAFSNIDGLTRERRRVATWYNPFGGTLAPTMKIRGWNITGVQQA